MAECKFNTLIPGIEHPALWGASASQGVFIWGFVKLKKCHVSINPSRPSLSNTLATVARAFIDLSTRHLTLQIADTPGCINVATVDENSNLQPLTLYSK